MNRKRIPLRWHRRLLTVAAVVGLLLVLNILLRFWNFLTLEMQTFHAIARQQIGRYGRESRG